MVVGGTLTELGTIGELAAAVGRKTHTIRGWERMGLIPGPPLVTQPGAECTRRRWYPAPLIAAIQQVALDEGFGTRRPSGEFLRQQERLWEVWRSEIMALNSEEPGITDPQVGEEGQDTTGQAQPHQ
jgi:hypothetical protein